MRILLVGNFIPDAQQSMQRYAQWLENSLSDLGHTVAVVRPTPRFSRLSRIPSISKYLGYIDKFLIFPGTLRRLSRHYDLVHILDHSNSMYISAVAGKPNLITCHDVLAIRSAHGDFPQSRTGWSGRLLQRAILSGLCQAPRILCVSSKTAQDLTRLIAAFGRKVEPELRVVFNPLNWNYHPVEERDPEMDRRLGLLPGTKYLLHVGGNQWYKNRLGVLHLFAAFRNHWMARNMAGEIRLLMVGKSFTEPMREFVKSRSLTDSIAEMQGVSNTDLQYLYSHAQALIFPSLEEGFGWPLLEAQACGCPVVTSSLEPMSEVVGNAAVLINVASDPQLESLKIFDAIEHRQALRIAGFANLQRFAQQTILDQYLACYQSALTSKPGASLPA